MESLAEKLIAVQSDAPETSGAIVWWRLSGATNKEVLASTWLNAGLDIAIIPPDTTPKLALNRALPVVEDKRHFLRALAKRSGWAVVEEQADPAATLTHQVVATVTADQDGIQIDPADYREAERVRVEYYACLDRHETTDISGWLAGRLMPMVKAVSLRDTGGIYFVPKEYLDLYRQYTDVLASVGGHKFLMVPALRSDEAVEAILDALCREAEQAMATIEVVLNTTDLGKRALNSRMGTAEAMLEKVRAYEQLLGRGLDELVKRVEGLKAGLTVALLSQEAGQLGFGEEVA